MLSANNELCLNCTKAECNGMCEALKDDMGKPKGKRHDRTLTWHGITRSVNEWAEVLGVSRQTMYKWLNGSDDIDKIIDNLKPIQQRKLPRGATELAIIRLSTMPLDYVIYWQKTTTSFGSAGMVARYGKIQTAPTNAVSKPTEVRAMPEINLSDEELNRRGWIGCVLYLIDYYRNGKKNNAIRILQADILEWRALEGLSLKKIVDRINEYDQPKIPFTINRARCCMNVIVEDLAAEAWRRGLIVEPQK